MKIRREIYLWLLVMLPAAYTAFIWNDLPASVPLHWNSKGEVDKWGSKWELITILLLPLLIYGLMVAIPVIDPKGKVQNMGGKYFQLKFVLVLFTSALSLFLLYMIGHQQHASPNLVFSLAGILFAALGNYFQSIKPNYFIGIRTPWTLESEIVWKKTHKLGGILWVIGGSLIVVLSILMDHQPALFIFLVITGVISLFPLIYSYIIFRRLNSN